MWVLGNSGYRYDYLIMPRTTTIITIFPESRAALVTVSDVSYHWLQYTKFHIINSPQWLVIVSRILGKSFFPPLRCLRTSLLIPWLQRWLLLLLNSALCCFIRYSIKLLALKERVSAERNLQSALSWKVSTWLTLDCRPAEMRGELLRCHKVVCGALWQVQVHGHSTGTRPVSISVHP